MKLSYTKPELVELGNVSDLTASNNAAHKVDVPFGTTAPNGTLGILGSI